ncbi:MAG: hypothetical protein A2X35_05300 [Elusimicrobia bacterium GWA2_61_42]|nr:MAG: hypothetical protein A2X35_05300 [Elusimicrobia bacterium GWA2_61_42]OGR74213.1 MAG: hypothetical protein A2X38_11365 [Elusimicrobia bacterium GWC2_61_25]
MKTITTKDDFDRDLGSGSESFMLFYSAWCPFCTMFLPAFEKAAAGGPAAFVKVSTDDLPELEEAFAVEVVPTVLFFKDGKLKKRLDGALGRGLTEENLKDFIKACGPKAKK